MTHNDIGDVLKGIFEVAGGVWAGFLVAAAMVAAFVFGFVWVIEAVVMRIWRWSQGF
jgi:hypothetical protein